ncbi:MAG: hypothetical protein E4G91_04380 [Candidatus Zixiibacteriota bacterium]|nr:MAG: hypothetical protein E4G91_04380 [candidate division Zixibacteria bacterium]
MFKNATSRKVLFVLLGVAILVLKRHYSGPFAVMVHSYIGNVSVSFAVYFVVSIAAPTWKLGKLPTAGIALLAVELFEATDGFGVMSNVFDQIDFIANAVGVGVALAVDTVADRISSSGLERHSSGTSAKGDGM